MFDWSGENCDESVKSQGILIYCVSGNPVLSVLRKDTIHPRSYVLNNLLQKTFNVTCIQEDCLSETAFDQKCNKNHVITDPTSLEVSS